MTAIALRVGDRAVSVELVQRGDRDAPRVVVSNLSGGVLSATDLASIEAHLVRMLGTTVDLDGFYALADHDRRIGPLKDRMLGVKPPPSTSSPARTRSRPTRSTRRSSPRSAGSRRPSGAGLGDLVDIRSYPGSRHNPQFAREAMERWMPAAGLFYSWMRDLGGRRKPAPDSPHVALRHVSFHAYADYMGTSEFIVGVDDLLAGGAARTVMCSESVWWRCHRRLVADYITLIRGLPVEHLMHDGRRTPHTPTDGVRRDRDHLIYDVGVPMPLPELADAASRP